MLHFSERIKICLLYEHWRKDNDENYTIEDSPISFVTFLMKNHWLDEKAMKNDLSLYHIERGDHYEIQNEDHASIKR